MAVKALSEIEMSAVKGGDHCCGCGCQYANSGGSSSNANGAANQKGGLASYVGAPLYCCEYFVSCNCLKCGF